MRFRLNEYLNESKADQQRFIDKFGQDTFNKFLKIKEKIQPKDEFISNITGEVVERPKDITYLMSVDKEVVDEMISFYDIKGQKDIENRPIPVPPNVKKLMYNKDGYKIYLITNYEDMIDVASLRYGSEIGKWCIAGRYATDGFTTNDIDNGQVKVSQAKQYFNQYLPKSPDGYYVVITPTGKKFCILVGNNKHQIWNGDDAQIEDYQFIDETSGEIAKIFGIHDWRVENYYYDGNGTIPQYAIHVVVNDGVRVIPKYTFSNRDLESVVMPDSVEIIDDYAFYDCRRLERIVLSKNLKTIGFCAFKNCYYLFDVELPDGLEQLIDGCFISCRSLKKISIPSTVKRIGNSCFTYSRVENITIQSGVTDIGDYCFYNTSIKDIEIPDTVASIGDYAFGACPNLQEVVLPRRFEEKLSDIGIDPEEVFVHFI